MENTWSKGAQPSTHSYCDWQQITSVNHWNIKINPIYLSILNVKLYFNNKTTEQFEPCKWLPCGEIYITHTIITSYICTLKMPRRSGNDCFGGHDITILENWPLHVCRSFYYENSSNILPKKMIPSILTVFWWEHMGCLLQWFSLIHWLDLLPWVFFSFTKSILLLKYNVEWNFTLLLLISSLVFNVEDYYIDVFQLLYSYVYIKYCTWKYNLHI
jgi:hypothetical protein